MHTDEALVVRSRPLDDAFQSHGGLASHDSWIAPPVTVAAIPLTTRMSAASRVPFFA